MPVSDPSVALPNVTPLNVTAKEPAGKDAVPLNTKVVEVVGPPLEKE